MLPTTPTQSEVSRSKIMELEAAMKKMPQLETITTNHYFADGMYCRSLWRPAGALIVGKVHKKEHLYIIASGTVQVTTEEGLKQITGPAVMVSKPGTKRAVLALTDATCITVHRTNETDLQKIEEDLIEPDQTALFDSHNQLKALK